MIRIFRGTFLLAMSLLSVAVQSVQRLADGADSIHLRLSLSDCRGVANL
jgi:hypothetical protein